MYLLSAGKTVVAPMAKASRSVTEVMVIATPACFIVRPSFLPNCSSLSTLSRLSKACMITNMSSMPTPSMRNGNNWFIWL